MKSAILPFLSAAVLLTSITMGTRAQEADPAFDPLGVHTHLPKLIRTQVEFIEVPHTTLTRLLSQPDTSTNHTRLRAILADLAARGEATVVETLLVTARSGQKATSESIQESIYPTEYEPPEMWNRPDPNARDEAGAQIAIGQTIGYTPSAFETRNVGSTLEIEPTLDESSTIIDLRFVPEITYHTGNETWAEWIDERGDASVRMPTFYTLRINTSLTLMAGQPLLAAALSPKNEDGVTDPTRKLMVFVRCDVLTVGN